MDPFEENLLAQFIGLSAGLYLAREPRWTPEKPERDKSVKRRTKAQRQARRVTKARERR